MSWMIGLVRRVQHMTRLRAGLRCPVCGSRESLIEFDFKLDGRWWGKCEACQAAISIVSWGASKRVSWEPMDGRAVRYFILDHTDRAAEEWRYTECDRHGNPLKPFSR